MFGKCRHHLDTVHEGYFKHLLFALRFGACMVGGGLAAIIHGLCPAFFEHTGSRTLFRLHDEVQARLKNCNSPDDRT